MRTHPDHVVAAALAAYDCIGTNDHRAIARAALAVGVPRPTVHGWIAGKRYISPTVLEARQAKKEDIAQRLETIVHSIIDCMPSKLDTAPLNQVAVALGICIDKRQLLLGQPNSIQAGVFLTADQREARLREIFDRRLAGKSVGQPVGQEAEIEVESAKPLKTKKESD